MTVSSGKTRVITCAACGAQERQAVEVAEQGCTPCRQALMLILAGQPAAVSPGLAASIAAKMTELYGKGAMGQA